jgi:hypothetical protein
MTEQSELCRPRGGAAFRPQPGLSPAPAEVFRVFQVLKQYGHTGGKVTFKRAALVSASLAIGIALAAEEPLPPGATRVGPNAYIIVDKDGKKKRVEKTPFGVAVTEVPPENAEAPAPPKPRTLAGDPMLRVEEKGDVVTFRRKTPFGEQVWQKKRAELTPDEKELVASRKQPPAGPASKTPAPAAKPAAGSKP